MINLMRLSVKMSSRKWSIMKKTIAGLFICCLLFIIALFATAKVTLTPSGSYHKLHLLGIISVKLAYSGTADKANFDNYPFSGPIVEFDNKTIATKNSNNTVHWYCLNQAYSQEVMQQKINIDCQGKSHYFQWSEAFETPVIEQDLLADNILVLSDIHGDIDYLNSILTDMKVVDEQGDWQWQENQLVITGDSVDKGPADFAVLWRLYQLSQQAKISGGAVHVLIGNHENYQLRGNHSRLHTDLRVKAFAMTENLTASTSAYSQQTILGKWLRTRPIVIRLGKYLFTHGGLSKTHLKSKYTLLELNESVWEYYRAAKLSVLNPTEQFSLTLGREGLLWFRGQLRENKNNTPSSKELANILKQYGAEILVIGHSAVDTLEAKVDNQVWPVHAEHNSGQVLLIAQGQAKIQTLNTQWYDYDSVKKEARKTKRPLRLFNSSEGDSELGVIGKMYTSIKELSRRTSL